MLKGTSTMNILLVNNDAAVEKLVRLSTQKTGDRLDVARSIDTVRDEAYDLLIMDKGLFSREALEALNDKAIYAHSIYITTRESGDSELFERLLYKPFLPTELLVLLHQFSTVVEDEKEALAKEIVFDDLEDDFFTAVEQEHEVAEVEQESASVTEPFQPMEEEQGDDLTEEAEEEEVLENIFSEQEVLEVKSILDALNEDEEEALVEEVIHEEEPVEEIDLELEKALQNLTPETLEDHFETETITPSVQHKSEERRTSQPSRQNQESIETLRTLLQALENPQIARSLRGTITINLTFGED